MTSINLSYLNELGDGDHEFVIEMLETYLDETTKDMKTLSQVLEEENLERIGFVVHRSKAAFRMLGLQDMTDLAQDIELAAKKGLISAKSLRVPINSLIEQAEQSFKEAQQYIDQLNGQ